MADGASSPPGPVLRGRRDECAVLDRLLDDARAGRSGAFVARRLLAESVLLLFAARQPSDELLGMPELAVRGLKEADARELLRSVVPGRLDERIREQVIAEARGNPLALLELTRGLSPAQLAGGFGLPGALSLEGRIQQSFLARVDALPEGSRRVLLGAGGGAAGGSGAVGGGGPGGWLFTPGRGGARAGGGGWGAGGGGG